jgi:hypothetical protein
VLSFCFPPSSLKISSTKKAPSPVKRFSYQTADALLQRRLRPWSRTPWMFVPIEIDSLVRGSALPVTSTKLPPISECESKHAQLLLNSGNSRSLYEQRSKAMAREFKLDSDTIQDTLCSSICHSPIQHTEADLAEVHRERSTGLRKTLFRVWKASRS